MNSRLFWLLLLSAVAATAQPTWGGLHFGMNVEDARKLLLGKIQSEDRAAKNPGVFTFTLKPEPLGLTKSTPHIIFKEGALTRVVLMFSEPASGCSAQRNLELVGREIAMIDEVGQASIGVFQEKYGKPINETGTWPSEDNLQDHFISTPNTKIECEKAWKSNGQTIRIALDLICDSLFLRIIYDPESSDPQI